MKLLGRFLLWLTFSITLIICADSYGAVSKKPSQGNSLGFLQYTENPYIYLEGEFRAGAYVSDKHALVIRVQPRGTYSLFTEDILFCPGADEKLTDKTGVLVFVYERVAHELVEGIGCHELRFVDEVKTRRNVP